MSEYHSFDTEVAKDVGVNAAVVFNYFCFWIKKNASEGVNLKDGDFWSFTSIRGLSELFPYLTDKQIRTAVDTLVSKKYLKKAQLCNNKLNRTMWYALDEVGKCFCEISQAHLPKKASVTSAQKGKSNIEVIEEVKEKKLSITPLPPEVSPQKNLSGYSPEWLTNEGVEQEIAEAFVSVRKAKKAPMTKLAVDALKREAHKAGITLSEAVQFAAESGYQSFKAHYLVNQNNAKSIQRPETFTEAIARRKRENERTIDITDAYPLRLG